MKNIWFYGCSLTAGDELFDEEVFPWKAECNCPNEYHKRRSKIFAEDKNFTLHYQARNKELAYPKKLEEISKFKSFNQAANGSSLKAMIARSVEDIFLKKPIDFIIFQLPIHHRELFLEHDFFESIQMSYENSSSDLNNYRKIKMKSHNMYQQAYEDFLDLLLYDAFLKKYKIPNIFLIVNENEYSCRVQDLQETNYGYMISEFEKLPNRLLLYKQGFPLERELAGHLTMKCHQKLAELLKTYLENFYGTLS